MFNNIFNSKPFVTREEKILTPIKLNNYKEILIIATTNIALWVDGKHPNFFNIPHL